MTAEQPQVSPGLHPGMSNDAYHAEAEHLSSTRLKKALPEKYREGDLSAPALAFGTLVHEVVLEPHLLDRYTVLDAAKIGLKADGTPAQNPTMTSAWKRAVAEAEAEGRTVVAAEDWDRAHRMAEAIRAHGEANEILHEGEGAYELSAFVADGDTKIKARFDRLIPGGIVDLKTTSAKPGERSLKRVTVDYLYHLSAAHYLTVADLLGLDVETFTLVYVGKDAPHYVSVTDLASDLIDEGRDLRTLALDRIAGRVEP